MKEREIYLMKMGFVFDHRIMAYKIPNGGPVIALEEINYLVDGAFNAKVKTLLIEWNNKNKHMKKAEDIKPNYGPVYAAALYPDLAKIFQKHGYALAVHGSLARDFDLIAIPWTENISYTTVVLKEIEETFAIKVLGTLEKKMYGRFAFTLSIGHGECAVDLSFILPYQLLTENKEYEANI